MMKSVGELALNLKVATLTLISGFGSFVATVWLHIESAIPSIAAVVALITGIIIAVAHYCKMITDNRAAKQQARINELTIKSMRLEHESRELDNEQTKLENKLLKKQLGIVDGDNQKG
jgi:cell shape-determining protein MreC